VKITNLSLAAIMAVSMVSVASADVDMKIGGQGVVYYQTSDGYGADTAPDMFDKKASSANAGLQLNANSDIGNGFGLGLQGTALSTWGLDNNLVTTTMQNGGGDTANATDYFAITKAYLTKKIGQTTLKMGRQELPKSLSPLAFSENWNVFKNTFDAMVAINSDIPDTTVVGAFVSRANHHADLSTYNQLAASAGGNANVVIGNGAYMLTVANKSVKELPITLSYYTLNDIKAPTNSSEAGSAVWGDIQANFAIPVKFGLQGGQISPENSLDDTTVFGAKVTGNAGPVSLKVAYSTVDDGPVAVKNVGTGVKTPLYTQMIANQDFISSDADTVLVQAKAPVGPGTLIAQYGATTDNKDVNPNDYNELDVMYKFKALGTTMLAAYVMQDQDSQDNPNNIIRLWTRYNF
jgi:hypothetical protein